MFFSKSTRGFYDVSINGDNIPYDATYESKWEFTYSEIMAGQSEGKIISSDDNGYPILVDPTPKTKSQLKLSELQDLAKVFTSNKSVLNAAWLAAAVADGVNENTRKDAVIADIADLQTQYDTDCAAVRKKYA